MKTKRRIPFSLSAAAVLLCLVLASAHLTSGLYARYTTGASGSDNGTLAAFNVSAKADEETVSIGTDGTGHYVVKVKNPGEVAVRYEARLSVSGEYAGLFDANKLQPMRQGMLAPGADAELTFEFDMSGTEITEPGAVPFTVTVTFTQID